MGFLSYVLLIFINATIFIKSAMSLLFFLFLFSFYFIILKYKSIIKYENELFKFNTTFYIINLDFKKIYDDLSKQSDSMFGVEKIFYTGFDEFIYLYKKGVCDIDTIINNVKDIMIVAMLKEVLKLHKNVYFFIVFNYMFIFIGFFCLAFNTVFFFQEYNINFYENVSSSIYVSYASESMLPILFSFFLAFPINIVYYKYLDFIFNLFCFYKIFINEFVTLIYHKIYN